MDFKKILGSIPFLAKKSAVGSEQTPPVEQVILQNGDNAGKSKQSRIVIIAGAMAIVAMGLAVGYMLVPKAEDDPLSQPLSKRPVPVGNLDKSVIITPNVPAAATTVAPGITDKQQGTQDGQPGVQIPQPANTQHGGVQQTQTQPAPAQEHTPKTETMGTPANQPSHGGLLKNSVNDATPSSKRSRETGRAVSEDSGIVPEHDPFKKEFLKKFKNDAAKEKLAVAGVENKNLKSLEDAIKKAQHTPVASTQPAQPSPPPPIKRELEIAISGVVVSSADTYAVSDKGVVRVGDPVGTYIIEKITTDIVQLKHIEDPKDLKIVYVGGGLGYKDKKDRNVQSAPSIYSNPYHSSNNTTTTATPTPRLMPY